MTDDEMLREALDALERAGCQFWACEGPTLEPIDMVTCFSCATVARLRHRLGLRVVHLEETREYEEAVRLKEEAKDSHRIITLDEALATVRARRLIDAFGTDPERACASA